MRIGGRRIEVDAPSPPPLSRLDEVLPLCREVVEGEIELATRQVASMGLEVSCRQGCAACCKSQPVPVTPPEAFALAKWVAELEPTQRDAVRERFRQRVQVLADAGLVDVYFQDRSSLSRDDARQVTNRYFQLRLECPFLIDDACSVYTQRPFVCRQYLVTSDPDHCEAPLERPVSVVPMHLKAASAFLKLSSLCLGKSQYTIPLILALEYVERFGEGLEDKFESEMLFRTWLELVSSNECEPPALDK
jgi:Fe-S-cluster containining protein